MINLENRIINKINSDYIQNLPLDSAIEHIPREQPISSFSPKQMSDFESLFHTEYNYFITVECENILSKETIEVGEDNILTIKQSPSAYRIKNLSFNYTSALIFIGMYYHEDVQVLVKENFKPAKINTLYFSFSFFALVILVYVFFWIDLPNKLLLMLVIGLGFCCLTYMYESLKALLPKQQKKKMEETHFHIAGYLAAHLQDFVDAKFKLDEQTN